MKGRNNTRWMILAGLVIAGLAAAWYWHSTSAAPAGQQRQAGAGRHGAGMRGGPSLAPVQAATATREAVPRYLSGLGTITAANTVTVRSRVDGQLLAVHFQEGQQVKKAICSPKSIPASLRSPLPRRRDSWRATKRRWRTPAAIWPVMSNW